VNAVIARGYGTFVNGQRIEHADLHDSDVIVIGRFELIYHET
jgi:pSer/pThr/pTyr-binding forkhead associated (FHA) protein